ncbi:Pogo transposable element with ZNF domain [Armadillidium nasatum]|uniref:Pogo transposable element with ZNF domain n=1 Tax=Armadillidium nasatum TaxID=96803 RepID=A0A5N5SJN5_9CRUS|nr:Pogo transposable element with ZNF domain [Armadillidium nasatum]
MVKGTSSKSSLKTAGISLVLECKNDELSDCQILHRKKQLEDIYLLQTALQGAAQNANLSSPLVNGGSIHNISSAVESAANNVKLICYDKCIMLFSKYVVYSVLFIYFKQATAHLRGILSRNGNINDNSHYKKRKAGNARIFHEPEQQQQQQSITQALRAARKPTTTSLPQTLKNVEDDEIEVLQETRKSGGSAGKTTFRSASTGNKGSKNATKPNNLLLLNINIRPRNLATVHVNASKRKELDMKVKNVLMRSPSEFVEWLLQQGLIRSQQLCSVHKTPNRQPAKLKLGMFNDPMVLTSSGGYVWIGECCGRKYISVYSGSIFGSTPIDKIPPTSILKLIYHWSCQTAINNVETWVKVEKQIISKTYHHLKCICSVILHDKIYDFGIDESPVELGIVSLGTTTADGSKKAVKVEILGLFDRRNGSYRLFASTPEPANNSKERFLRILKPVREVVHKKAKIICDQSVEPTSLNAMGYSNVHICSNSENENDLNSNSTIMFYLRKHVPKMFQAALSQLTENQVQLTLDELCWREKFGPTAADCYDNIMEHVSYITYRELENPGILPLLEYVSEFPHKNFRYKYTNTKAIPPIPTANVIMSPTTTPLHVIPTQYNENMCLAMGNKVVIKNGTMSSEPIVPPLTIKNLSSIRFSAAAPKPIELEPSSNNVQSGEFTNLESYFYGKIEGNPSMGKEYNAYSYKCHLCSETLEDNVLFYSHLKYHLEGQTPDKEKLDLVCPYCTNSFTSVNSLNKHKIDIINHFNKTHKGTPYVQCHFCLSIKTLTPNGASSFSQRLFQHMQRHSQKINCRSCVLVFYSKYLLTEHKKEHLPCTNVKGFLRYESPNGYRTLQFKPNIKSMPLSVNDQVTAVQTKNQAALSITLKDIPNLRLHVPKSCSSYRCIECDGELGAKAHFNQYRTCSKCSYSTSCQNMIVRHAQVFHPPSSKKPLPYVIGNPTTLDSTMYCSCGFSTRSGNHLANHLVSCKKKRAYSNPEGRSFTFLFGSSGNSAPPAPPLPDASEIVECEYTATEPIDLMEVVEDEVLPILPLSVEIQED